MKSDLKVLKEMLSWLLKYGKCFKFVNNCKKINCLNMEFSDVCFEFILEYILKLMKLKVDKWVKL